MPHEKAVFDQIAEFYDSTRGPARGIEIDSIASELGTCRTVLEIGVGTGRIAKPLHDRGFQITGIDLSVGMMEKAREKGIEHLVIGDARELPFLDKSFDATLTVHVFHLIEDRKKMMQEAARVSRKMILSLVRKRNLQAPENGGRRELLQKIYIEARENHGFPLNNQGKYLNRLPDHSILDEFPPYRKIPLGEFRHKRNNNDFAEKLKHSSRFVALSEDIPHDINMKIMEEVREKASALETNREEVISTEYLCVWRPDDILSSH